MNCNAANAMPCQGSHRYPSHRPRGPEGFAQLVYEEGIQQHLQHFQACTSAGSDLGSDFACDRSTTSSVAHADWKAFEINTAGAVLWLHHSTAVYGQISLAGTLTSKAAASGTRHN